MVNGAGGDVTPKYDAQARSADGVIKKEADTITSEPDASVPNTTNSDSAADGDAASSSSGYPAPIGPPR